ncbi:MAG: 4Fe-4S dicluster domain-containing protein [Proteobacteria bacterium]|nr:4Fe-4S dicluster domain-containing protein [Pseudomonadota bacterium]
MNQTSVLVKSKKARKVAVVAPWCTGCGGAPVCLVYCKRGALSLVKDPDAYPFTLMTVNEKICIGCEACVSAGDQGIMLKGCPWNAIHMEALAAT